MSPLRRVGPVLVVGCLPLLAGCGGNPAQQVADTVVSQVSTAHRTEVVAALAGDAQALSGYQATNGTLPAGQAEFAAIPGVERPGVSVTYTASGSGWCLVGTSTAQPASTVVWTQIGQQPAGVTRCP